jgi:hypothetical protein
MFSKDFENFELRIKKLREESLEDFENAERVFEENYRERLEDIFPRDVLGVKKYIAGYFEIAYVDALESGKTIEKKAIFQRSVEKVIKSVPLSAERKRELTDNILKISSIPETLQSYFAAREDISRDPFFALVEDFSLDGDISREEFFILQQSYQKERDFIKALDSLPEQTREMFHEHIEKIFSHENSPKREAFESEYHQELKNLQKRGFNVQPVVVFVSRCYYKNPGKLKKYEHPKRRLRRTFKMALLKLLRAKLGNIDAEIFLKRFEEGEYFEDFFLLLYKLLEVVDENPKSEEIYSVLKLDEETQSVVYDAEKTKEKILE